MLSMLVALPCPPLNGLGHAHISASCSPRYLTRSKYPHLQLLAPLGWPARPEFANMILERKVK